MRRQRRLGSMILKNPAVFDESEIAGAGLSFPVKRGIVKVCVIQFMKGGSGTDVCSDRSESVRC